MIEHFVASVNASGKMDVMAAAEQVLFREGKDYLACLIREVFFSLSSGSSFFLSFFLCPAF